MLKLKYVSIVGIHETRDYTFEKVPSSETRSICAVVIMTPLAPNWGTPGKKPSVCPRIWISESSSSSQDACIWEGSVGYG
jgi:hypothetical protein